MSTHLTVVTSINSITTEQIRLWRELEEEAAFSNFYASADYTLSAVSNFRLDDQPIFIFIETIDENLNKIMIFSGAFFLKKRNFLFPFNRLLLLKPPHNFLPGVLINKNYSNLAISSLADFLQSNSQEIASIELTYNNDNLVGNNVLSKFYWCPIYSYERAILNIRSHRKNPECMLSKNTLKNIKRKIKNISKLGDIKFEIKNEKLDDSIENFLLLENDGWKKICSSSLLSHDSHKNFFIDLCKKMEERKKVFFSEISLNGKVIASTSNFISGNAGFAFKLGWKKSYEKYSPGLLNEYFLITQAPEKLRELKYIDSGSTPDSFMYGLWKDRQTLLGGYYCKNLMVQKYTALYFTGRNIFYRFKFLLSKLGFSRHNNPGRPGQ